MNSVSTTTTNVAPAAQNSAPRVCPKGSKVVAIALGILSGAMAIAAVVNHPLTRPIHLFVGGQVALGVAAVAVALVAVIIYQACKQRATTSTVVVPVPNGNNNNNNVPAADSKEIAALTVQLGQKPTLEQIAQAKENRNAIADGLSNKNFQGMHGDNVDDDSDFWGK